MFGFNGCNDHAVLTYKMCMYMYSGSNYFNFSYIGSKKKKSRNETKPRSHAKSRSSCQRRCTFLLPISLISIQVVIWIYRLYEKFTYASYMSMSEMFGRPVYFVRVMLVILLASSINLQLTVTIIGIRRNIDPLSSHDLRSCPAVEMSQIR